MFEVGDNVVHPVYGAGTITRIEKRLEGGRDVTYYVIPTEPGTTNLLVPADSARDLGLREVIPAARVEDVFDVLKSDPKPPPECKALAGPLKKMDWSDPCFLAALIRDLLPAERGGGKISAVQRKALKRAQKLLIGELSLATGTAYAVTEEMVVQVIAESPAAQPPKIVEPAPA